MLTEIFEVFSNIGTWLQESLQSLTSIFWNATDNSLTLLGTLAVIGLGFSVIFLLIGIIQRFLHFRG